MKTPFLYPRHFQLGCVCVGGGGGHVVSPLSVRTSVPYLRPVRNTNGFRAISFEKIGIID